MSWNRATRPLLAALASIALLAGCSSYQYAKNVKMVSFDGDATRGTGAGPVRGKSCQASIFGYPISDAPTLDDAVHDAMTKGSLRYMNNVSTDTSGFNAVVYARRCIVVKGTGFK